MKGNNQDNNYQPQYHPEGFQHRMNNTPYWIKKWPYIDYNIKKASSRKAAYVQFKKVF